MNMITNYLSKWWLSALLAQFPSRREKGEASHNILWFSKGYCIIFQNKKLPVKKSLPTKETLPVDLMMFQEIFWEKSLPNRHNINFQWILISCGSESHKIFPLRDFECEPNRHKVHFQQSTKSAKDAWFLVCF